MTKPLAIVDVGDVLISTHPMKQYHAIAEHTGLEWRHVANIIEETGLVAKFELGDMQTSVFIRRIRQLVGRHRLSNEDAVETWNSVIGSPVPEMIDAVRPLAADCRLLLASNTNPIHWRHVRDLLEEAGVTAPRILSYETGQVKPASGFFAAVRRIDLRADHTSVFIDDRPENVAAARAEGISGWVHRTPAESSQLLRAFHELE